MIRYGIWRPGKPAFCDAGLRVPEYTSLEVRNKLRAVSDGAVILHVLVLFAPREPRAYSDRYIQYASYVHYITVYPVIRCRPIFFVQTAKFP